MTRATRLGSTLMLGLLAAACGNSGDEGPSETREFGQSDFTSAAPGSGTGRGNFGSGGSASGGPAVDAGDPGTGSTRKVEETDLYRLEGDRLYFLNAYRGLMVFDVSNVDAPRLLGRSAIYGTPIEMIVRDGVASIVVSDWYGKMDDGTPFHGSIVRGVDARDPANMKILGEAKLGGYVRDTRVVGDVIYAVTEVPAYDYGWYGWYGLDGVGAVASTGNRVNVSSVSFAAGAITHVDSYDVPGYSGIFNVTPNAILFAYDVLGTPDQYGYAQPTGQSELRYLDISSPSGEIAERGVLRFDGSTQGWGADGGRWNLDFADGAIAHFLACGGQYCGNGQGSVLVTADFTNPDSPALMSTLAIPSTSWSPVARFDSGRMYLAPNASGCYYYYGTGVSPTTPVQIYDLADPAAPALVGSTEITGEVYLFMPSGDRLFALGSDCAQDANGYYNNAVALRYLDVTNPAAPQMLGTSEFGEGWAWTPAAGTFKAFTKDDAQGLVVLPFSGWSPETYSYNNGLQLIEFTSTGIATSGTAKTKGWVERGIFVQNRLVSLSSLALSVVDYTDHANPTVVSELTLARNVVNVKPSNGTVAELSSDWWDNDQDHSMLRVLPVEQAEENVSGAALAELEIEGYNPRIFHNGDLSYVVSTVRVEAPCPDYAKSPDPATQQPCYTYTQQIQVVDRAGGNAVQRGSIRLPEPPYGSYWYGGWGWYGCGYWDWYHGDDVVQVDGDALAFRRWMPIVNDQGTYLDSLQSLFVVDASNPDMPTVGSSVITTDQNGWWGNMRAFGGDLYVSHYDWVEQPSYTNDVYFPGVVRYYADKIDLSDRAQPRIAARINVPGMLIGASETDPSLIYTMDYRWYGDHSQNELAVLRVQGDKAYLQGTVTIPGWVGSTFVRGSTAYFSVQHWDAQSTTQQLFQIDLSVPTQPRVMPSDTSAGWGWLLGVEGDRAIVTSGWGNNGVDIFKLSPNAPPQFDQFVRTRGFWTSSLARQGDDLFLASGYWGTQTIRLE